MGSKLYVGNLSYDTTQQAVQGLFAQTGVVSEVVLVQDRDTGRSRGFAFVTMGSETEAQTAISVNNGKEFEGRALIVNEAKPREDRPPQSNSSARNQRHTDSRRSHDHRDRKGRDRHRRSG